ncbi:DUF72 domain-containing protein [Luteimonas sp. SJ-92]|uniref:DUF72 domain-containing protein n=1 Tax=Luteimonas salinisoli TaxID=2752307 RepID=A0A853JFY8_9GAMM|nr:DUF72 domain-containing protein [Luteimonas salinisoli]NZA27765.1 DUF72 domain-containing protein [Luteimonas salinisoli]
MSRRSVPHRSAARLRIGCAGWSIASAHRHLFGAGDSMLARYATRFDTVEINSSFYRPHRHATYARWTDTVPDDFRFSVKLPRTITHELRLQRAGPLLDAFLAQAGGLGGKLGCLLVQLPPSLAFDARAAATFFAMLRRRWDGAVACEPRHPSWFAPERDALWARHRIARVAADPARVPEAAAATGEGAVRYWRWHGAPRIYYSAYGEPALRELAAAVAHATPGDAEAWVVFDNTAHGHATTDAASFQALADRR